MPVSFATHNMFDCPDVLQQVVTIWCPLKVVQCSVLSVH
jgi:hypothetical protein